MAASDPRLADPLLLRVAALRARQRQSHPPGHAPYAAPDPGLAWWQEFEHVMRELPHGREVLMAVGMAEAEARAWLAREGRRG